MADMVSLKTDKSKMNRPTAVEDSEYGYGTVLNLEQDQIEALGLAGCKPGETLQIVATGTVKSVGMTEDLKSKSGHMCIQLTEALASKQGKDVKATADSLYNGDSVEKY